MRSRDQAVFENLRDYAQSQIEERIYISQWGIKFADLEKIGIREAIEKANEAEERLQEKKVEAKTMREEKISPSSKNETFNIIDEIQDQFITSTECHTLFITGDAGSGKSSLSKQLVITLWEKNNKLIGRETPFIPLCIELLNANIKETDLLGHYLSQIVGCVPEEIRLIKEMAIPMLLILDGMDEVYSISPESLLSKIRNADWPNPFKFIITSRRLGNNLIETNIKNQMTGKILSYHILPFTDHQVKQYLIYYSREQAEKSKKDLHIVLRSMPSTLPLETTTNIFVLLYAYYSPWTVEQYEQALRMLPELQEFATNPYMLKQVAEAEVLPAITEKHTQEEKTDRVKLTHASIYERFTKHYFERQLKKHPIDLLDEFNRVIKPSRKNSGDFELRLEVIKDNHGIPSKCADFFPTLLQIYNQKLAHQLFIERQTVVNGASELGKEYFHASYKLSSYYPFSRLLHLCSPIKHLGNDRYTFLHKSLLEFFAARYLFNSALTRSWVKIGRDLNSGCLHRSLSITKTPVIQFEKISSSAESHEEIKSATLDKKIDLVERKNRSIELTELKMASPIKTMTHVSSVDPLDSKRTDHLITPIINNDDDTLASIIDYLADMTQSDAEFKETLLDIINISKHVPYVWRAAANAITILNRAKFNFGGMDFRGIRIGGVEEDGQIWGADLSKSLCHDTDFGGADLRGVTWRDGWIAGANFSDSCMDQINFGELPYLPGNEVFFIPKENKLITLACHSTSTTSRSYYLSAGTGEYYYYFNHIVHFHFNVYTDYLQNNPIQTFSHQFSLNKNVWEDIHPITAISPNLKTFAWTFLAQSSITGYKLYSRIKLCSLSTGKLLAELGSIRGKKEANCFVYSPDGEQIAIAEGSSIILCKTTNGENWRLLKGHADNVIALAYSPDEKQLASSSRDKTIRLWETVSGVCIHTIRVEHEITTLCYRPGFYELASGNNQGEIHIWSTLSTAIEKKFDLFVMPSVPTNKNIPAGTNSAYVLIQSSPDTLPDNLYFVDRVRFTPVIKKINFPPGKSLDDFLRECYPIGKDATLSKEKLEKIGRIVGHTYHQRVQMLTAHDAGIMILNYVPDGSKLISTSEDQCFKAWQIDTKYALAFTESMYPISHLACMDNHIVAFSHGSVIRLWDSSQRKASTKINKHKYPISSIACRFDGKEIATTAHHEDSIRLWSMDTGECTKILKGWMGGVCTRYTRFDVILQYSSDKKREGHVGPVTCVHYKPFSTRLISGGVDGQIRIWETKTGKCEQEIFTTKHIKGAIYSLDHHPTENKLLIRTNKAFYLLSNHKELIEMHKSAVEHKSFIFDWDTYDDYVGPYVSFSPTGNIHTDKGKYISHDWRPDGLQCALVSKTGSLELKHNEVSGTQQKIKRQIKNVSYSSDSKLLASTDTSGVIAVWEIKSDKCHYVHEIDSPSSVQFVKWSPIIQEKDNTVLYFLISGTNEGVVRLWQVKKAMKEEKSASITQKIQYSHQLFWQTHPILFSYNASLMSVLKLSKPNHDLLLQLGAKNANKITEKEYSKIIKDRDTYERCTGTTVHLPFSEHNISEQKWVITLAREVGYETFPPGRELHTFLILQGITLNRELGQHFLVLKEIHFLKQADIQIRDVSLDHIKERARKISQKSFPISKENADQLLMNVIRDQRRHRLNYAFLGSSFFGKAYNCLTYAEEKLSEVGIDPTKGMFNLIFDNLVGAHPAFHLPAPPENKNCIIL